MCSLLDVDSKLIKKLNSPTGPKVSIAEEILKYSVML